jgi:phosphate uptake regulator
MKRKVIKQGNQAYTITLPIEWIRSHKIDRKSEVDITESGKSLIINSDNPVSGGSVSLDIENLNERAIYRIINALYAKGVDEIRVKSSKDASKILLKAGSNNLGFALVSQENNSYIIRDVSGTNYSNLDEIFKRVFQMILFFYDSAVEDIFGKEEEKLENLTSRDLEVNKFCLYLQRAINKMSYQDSINGRVMFTYSFELEKIGDEIMRLWRTNIKYSVKKSKKLKEFSALIKKALEETFDSYYQFNTGKIEMVHLIRDKIREESMPLATSDSTTTRFVRHLVKIAEECADLSHLTLMRKL